MATIQERVGKNGQIKYRALVRLQGFPEQSATFDRKTDARLWAQKTEVDLQAGRIVQVNEARRRAAVELIDRYIADVLPYKRRSCVGQTKTELKWWRQELRGLKVADVTPSVIAACRDKLARTLN